MFSWSKFQPKEAIGYLNETSGDDPLRVAALAGLIVWSLLDQREGKKSNSKKPRFRTKNAKDAVIKVILNELAHQISEESFTNKLVKLATKPEFFAAAASSRSIKAILRDCDKSLRDTRYCFGIIAFLARGVITPDENSHSKTRRDSFQRVLATKVWTSRRLRKNGVDTSMLLRCCTLCI